MPANHVANAYLADLQTAHRDLRQRQRRMLSLVAAGQQNGWRAGDLAHLRDELDELCRAVERHFAQEEAGGYLEEAVTRLPRLHGQSQRLLAEHVELLAQLQQLSQFVRLAQRQPGLGPELARRLTAALERLAVHEEAENSLLQRGFNVCFEEPG